MAFLEHCVGGMNFCAAASIKFGLGFSLSILHTLTALAIKVCRALAPQIILVLSEYCVLISCFLLYILGTKTYIGVAYSFFKTVYTVSSLIFTKAVV